MKRKVISGLLLAVTVGGAKADQSSFNNPGPMRRSADNSFYSSQSSYSTRAGEYDSKPISRQLGAASSSSATYDQQEEFGNYAAASSGGYGHGGGGYGHGGGHGGYGHGGGGYGHGGGGYGKKAGCNSALGLLGVLGLASYLQNVLNQMTTTAAGRKRRDVDTDTSLRNDTGSGNFDAVRVTSMMLPMLSAVAHVKDGLVPFECAHHPVCEANRILVHELGDHGASIGSMVTSAVTKLLLQPNKVKQDLNGGKHGRIHEAGKMGRVDKRCDNYEYCKQLRNLPLYAMPPAGSF